MKPATYTLILILLSPFFLYTTCRKIPPGANADQIIVGWGGGFAGMARYYLIGDGKLRLDTTHKRLGDVPEDVGAFQFDYVLPDSVYKKVADLKQRIPQELLDHNNETFGKSYPDGGYYEVRTLMRGTAYRWLFEADQRKSSAAVRAFYERLQMLH